MQLTKLFLSLAITALTLCPLVAQKKIFLNILSAI